MTFRVFISSVQDEFAEERRQLKEWLTRDLFVSRFVESVFLFEHEPSRGKPPQEVFLDEVKSSDIYIGLVGSQYYGKTSSKRGVSATEQEYDAAGTVDCERWVYLKAVDKRDKKASAFVSRVNRDVTRTMFVTFEDLKSAVYASFVSFLDRRELIDVGDFDKSVCRKNGNPPPKFEQNGATFIVTLRKRTVPSGHANDPMDDPINEAIKEAIKNHPGITKPQLAKKVGKSEATVKRALAALVATHIVEHRGSNRFGGYFVAEYSREGNDLMDSEAINEGIIEPLNEPINEPIKVAVIEAINARAGISKPQLAKIVGKNVATIKRTLAKLISAKRVEYRGSKKTGGYYLVEGGVVS